MQLLTIAKCGHYALTRETTGSRSSVRKAVEDRAARPCLDCLSPQYDPFEWDAWSEEREPICCYECEENAREQSERLEEVVYIRLYAECGILVPHFHYPRWDERQQPEWTCQTCGILVRESA